MPFRSVRIEPSNNRLHLSVTLFASTNKVRAERRKDLENTVTASNYERLPSENVVVGRPCKQQSWGGVLFVKTLSEISRLAGKPSFFHKLCELLKLAVT
jgi:hypothetical protein